MKAKVPGVLSAWLALMGLAGAQAESPPPASVSPAAVGSGYETLPPGLRLGTGVVPEQAASWFISADYLLWWMKPTHVSVPVLTTTRTPQDLSRGDPSLNNPNITVLFGNQNIEYPAFDGLRVRAGIAPTERGDPGFEVGGFFLPLRGTHFQFQTDRRGMPALVLPFENIARSPPVEAGAPFTGSLSGQAVGGEADISAKAQLWDGEISASLHVLQEDNLRLDLFTGGRHLGYTDELTIQVNSVKGAESARTFDQFASRNYFFGAQVGGRVGWEEARFSAQLTGKLALGVMDEVIRISGVTDRPASIVKLRAGPQEVQGGFFSFSSLGLSRNTRFAVVPEVGLNLGWRITESISLLGGYNFLYWSSLMRSADQINRNLNQRQLPLFGGDFNNPPSPWFLKRTSDFWAHGLNAGLVIDF